MIPTLFGNSGHAGFCRISYRATAPGSGEKRYDSVPRFSEPSLLLPLMQKIALPSSRAQ
jgi:hypothetical protein